MVFTIHTRLDISQFRQKLIGLKFPLWTSYWILQVLMWTSYHLMLSVPCLPDNNWSAKEGLKKRRFFHWFLLIITSALLMFNGPNECHIAILILLVKRIFRHQHLKVINHGKVQMLFLHIEIVPNYSMTMY